MKEKNKVIDWFLRLIKGAVIGMDVVLPGISGAALAVVFGLYERIVQFIAHITRDFVKNVLFFLPVGCGTLFGIYLISYPIKFLLENYSVPFYWFFVGAVLGTMPQLWKKSGEKGRKPLHTVMLALTFVLTSVFLLLFGDKETGKALWQFTLNPATAVGAGAMVALVVFIPGFSSSTFLLLLGLYEPMNSAINGRNLNILIPFALGLGVFVFPFSRGVEFLLKRVFTGFFHIIIGLVLASAVFIASLASKGYDYMQIGSLVCLITCIAGAIFSYWMCKLSKNDR